MKKFRTQIVGAVVVPLFSIAVTSPAGGRAGTAYVSFSVHATYCESSATMQPITKKEKTP
jgi:hypothetical protein